MDLFSFRKIFCDFTNKYTIKRMTLTFSCRRLYERGSRWDRIECNMTSEEPFSDDIMRAVNSTLQRVPSIADTPINGNDYY